MLNDDEVKEFVASCVERDIEGTLRGLNFTEEEKFSYFVAAGIKKTGVLDNVKDTLRDALRNTFFDYDEESMNIIKQANINLEKAIISLTESLHHIILTRAYKKGVGKSQENS